MLAAVKKNFYRHDPGNQLNLITLRCTDKEMQESLGEHRFHKLVQMRWFLLFFSVLSSSMHYINYFLLKKGHPMLCVTAIGVMIFACSGVLFTKLKFKNVCKIMTTGYFYVHVVGVSLVYMDDVLPNWLQGQQK